MWQLLAAFILTTSRMAAEDVTVRVENDAGCAVRIQVLQRGAYRYTIFVDATRTVTERFRVTSTLDPLSFRVIGIGCPFARYTVQPLNHFETSLLLRIASAPAFSYMLPYRAPR